MMYAMIAFQFLALTAATPAPGPLRGAGGDPPARVTVTTRKADDTATVGGDQDRTTVDIRSPSGISRAVIRRTGDAWPKAVVLRLRLKGLESLTVSAGATTVGAAVAARAGTVESRQWQGTAETPLAAGDPLHLAIRVVGKDGKPAAALPLDGGYFEVTLPAAFLKGNPESLTAGWVDFYR